MLETKINIIPHGIKSLERTLDTITIINDGTGTISNGNYICRIKDKNVYVEDFDRIGKDATRLLYEVLKKYYKE